MKRKAIWVVVLACLVPLSGFSAIPGKYDMVVPHMPPRAHSLDRVVIKEIFSFDCGHCYVFHKKQLPKLKKKFGDKIKFVPQPIGWRGHDPGRLYFVARQKGKGNQVINMIFAFIHDKGLGRGMYNRDKLKFVAKLNGLSKEFETMMDDPQIVKKMTESVRYSKSRKINSTPTLVIEDVMMVDRSFANLVTIINALLKEPVP
ncbi:MAG: thioredoxin domain-containing protein [Proteobacteria bacterium]|nr:thioredoxin domain-containing protein [Pseudomonadota bacterium]